MKKAGVFAALAAISLVSPASAWNNRGHMMVAAIAYDQLTPDTKKRVNELLRLNQYPMHGDRTGISPANRAKATFMQAATAPDAIKSDHQYRNDGNDADAAPGASLNKGFRDELQHRYWHYVDNAFAPAGVNLHLPATPRINALERIITFKEVLGSAKPEPLKAYDLVWILHLVGDVHQPLHDVTRITADDPDGDDGGNGVTLCLVSREHCNTKLHSYWDGLEGTSESVMDAIKAACALEYPGQAGAAARADCANGRVTSPSARPAGSSNQDVAVWVSEGVAVAKSDAYSPPIGDTLGPFLLTQSYKDKAHADADERILVAGARLADLLNASLK